MMSADIRFNGVARRALLVMAASAIAVGGTADARAVGDMVDVAVVDRETGEQMRVWPHEGRMYVAGRPGARYGLRVTNNSRRRVLVVMSVDGVNVLTGETADHSQRGYVFEPYQSYDVTGWRKSNAEVAAFTFAPLPRSYAARTGRPYDVGVIGIAAFTERVAPPPYQPPAPAVSESRGRTGADTVEEAVVTGSRRGGAAALAAPPPPPAMATAPSARAPAPEVAAAQRRSERLGTGHGAREWSYATTVPFERATRYPQLVRRIEYDSYENLVAVGVIRPSWDRPRGPRPFPGNGYVPDPPGGL